MTCCFQTVRPNTCGSGPRAADFQRGQLAPAELKKDAGAYDLPVALALLVATEQLAPDRLGEFAIAGELALDGSVRPVRGALAMAMNAAKRGIAKLLLPAASAREAAVVK